MSTIQIRPPQPFEKDRVTDPPLLIAPNNTPVTTVEAWEEHRQSIEHDWLQYLGQPPFAAPPLDVRTIDKHDMDSFEGRLLDIRMEPNYGEQCYLMVPKSPQTKKLPAVIIFYYDVDTPAGHNMGSPRWREGLETRHFARHLVERGYVTIVQRWFYEGQIAQDNNHSRASLAQRYAPVVKRQEREAPGWKGLGRVVWDARRVVDYLQTLDFVDPDRIACMGHSLGGKMALYAAAFDRRIRASVGSDLGIGLPFSNWDAPWYLGPEVREPNFGRDHHQLLALMAPRPFLLVAGEDADGDRSWRYLNTARDVYALYGAEEKVAMYNHRTGHAPTWDAIEAAYGWLDVQLGHEPSKRQTT